MGKYSTSAIQTSSWENWEWRLALFFQRGRLESVETFAWFLELFSSLISALWVWNWQGWKSNLLTSALKATNHNFPAEKSIKKIGQANVIKFVTASKKPTYHDSSIKSKRSSNSRNITQDYYRDFSFPFNLLAHKQQQK
jgi:hypothetical protein